VDANLLPHNCEHGLRSRSNDANRDQSALICSIATRDRQDLNLAEPTCQRRPPPSLSSSTNWQYRRKGEDVIRNAGTREI
jgi:hypothetical protein